MFAPSTEEGNTEDDAVPEVEATAVTQPGDLWLLGAHRLLCGDSTRLDAVERVLGGSLADMVFTGKDAMLEATGETFDKIAEK